MAQVSAIVAAERRVVQSRRDLRAGLRRLQHRLSRPSFLAAAAGVGALLGFSLRRGGRADALARTLAIAWIRKGVRAIFRSGRGRVGATGKLL